MRKAIGRISIAFFHIPLYCRKILIFRSSSQAKKPQSRRKPRASLRPHVSAGCVSGRCKYAGADVVADVVADVPADVLADVLAACPG